MENKNIPVLRFPEFVGEWKVMKVKDFATVNPKTGTLPNSFLYIDLESVKQGELTNRIKLNRGDAPSRAQRLLEVNDVLFQTVRPYQKNNYFFDDTNNVYVASTGYAQLRTKYNSRFLYQLLYTNSFVNNVLKRCTGTSYPAISSLDLSTIPISIPSDKGEQQKIASFLSAMDKQISILEQKKTKLEEYKKGIMQKIFSQEYRFKDEDGKDFPKWEKKRLGEITDIIGGGTPSTLNESFWNGTINWFTPSEIKSKYVNNSLRKITEQGLEGSSAKLLPINTILFTSRATLGDVSITNVECTTNQGFQSFVPSDNYCTEFLYYWILMNRKKFIRKSSGSTFMEISKTEIQKINILLPVLAEQERIASFLAAIDTKIEKISAQIEQTKSFKKGLLQQMFV